MCHACGSGLKTYLTGPVYLTLTLFRANRRTSRFRQTFAPRPMQPRRSQGRSMRCMRCLSSTPEPSYR